MLMKFGAAHDGRTDETGWTGGLYDGVGDALGGGVLEAYLIWQQVPGWR